MSFVDSITVQFLYSSTVIYGLGNQLIIQNEKFRKINKIRPYDKIHKITFLQDTGSKYRIACAAGREILLTDINNEEFNGGFLTKFNDWISSIKYLKNGMIAAITAHNIAVLLIIENNNLVISEKIKCTDNSTLYCSNIHGDLWQDLIFLSGTALGELIIWNVKGETIYQKSTHNGVIFSINYDENHVVTSSDDRSIKIYKVENDFSQLVQLKQLFGHTSRVFVGKIIKYNDELMFLSAGEDSNLCIWNENGTLASKKNINASGGIWDLDYDPQTATIVTSSSSGRLNRFQLRKMFYECHEKEVLSTTEEVEPARLLYLENGTLCVLDNKMQIFTKISQDWEKADLPINFHKIVSMESFGNRVFLAAKCSILIFDYSNTSNKLHFTFELNVNEKFSALLPQPKLNYFRSIHPLSRNEILISDVFGSCMLIDVEKEIIKNLFKIPKSNEPWTTSIAKIDNYWIIADRIGSLFLYENCEYDLSMFHTPIQKISKLHGQTGVTTIRVEADDFIKTTGNDGTVKTLRLNRKTLKLEFYQLERTTHVHFIEKVRTYKGKSYVHGFNDNYFVLYKDREIIFEHRCGGRHRHWDVTMIDENESKMQFSYIYKKQVHCVEFFLNDSIFDSKNDIFWHTKQCNSLRVIDDMKMLVTGSEDTTLKLTKIKVENGKVSFTKIADINSHISSIKAIITWTEMSESDDLYIISLGGRAQIVLTRVINRQHVKEEINFMLTNSLLCGYSKESTFDPETRFTCAHFDVKKRHLFVGCSDGYLRIFKLVQNEFSSSLKPLIESFYGRCILHITVIKSFVITMGTDGIVCFWYFNENLQLSEASQQVQCQEKVDLKIIYKLHHNQNGINCFDVFVLDIDRYIIATSGDDNCIYVTEFKIMDNSIKVCGETIKSHGIHIAQVTGIKFITHDELLTASVDQTLCKVKIKADTLELVERRLTCISDVKGFSIFERRFILVYGAGLEAIDYF